MSKGGPFKRTVCPPSVETNRETFMPPSRTCTVLTALVLAVCAAPAHAQTLGFALGLGAAGSDQGTKVVVDGAGNVYVTGYFQNTVDFDPGPGVTNLTSAGSNDIFFAK